MKTVSEYCQNNILVIPQALNTMQDVRLLFAGSSSLYYKCLKQDLLDVEFYSHLPCLVYIESGQEVLTNSDNHQLELDENSAVLLPKGMHLHSDFVKSTDSLRAFLVFLDYNLISEFLISIPYQKKSQSRLKKIHCDQSIRHYFQSILLLKENASPCLSYMNAKLLELLHLLAMADNDFASLLYQMSQEEGSTRRNLQRLLSSSDVLGLSINDIANLSGRSLSSFSRDFKRFYDTTPKKWLQEKRLQKANELLINTDFSVTHIANELGYDNVSHFIKAFKAQYKVTPKQLKQII